MLLVTVLYNERIEATATYRTLLQNRTNVLVIENSPTPLNNASNFPASWSYVSFPENPGLSTAYNHAAEFARQHDYEWILLTDQDTSFPDGILEKYRAAIEANPNIELFCPQISIGENRFMSPVPMKHYRCHIRSSAPVGTIDLRRFAIINSGMLIHLPAFAAAGGYRPEVSLDFADFQFLERFRTVSAEAFVIDAVCRQTFSNEVQTSEQKMNRYRLFCRSLRNFLCIDRKDRKYIHRTVFQRACSLAFSEKTFRPFKIFYTDYLK